MIYQFGTFELDGESMELRKNGRLVAIEPQPARALALLLSRAGDVVTREELRVAIWGQDTHVDFDRGLAYCLSAVRLALGDKGDNPRFVQTLPRKGYCFVAPVKTVPFRAARVPKWLPWAAALLILGTGAGVFIANRPPNDERTVIAVSLFDNETGDSAYDRLVTGLSDSVVVSLTELAPARIAVVGNAEVLRQPRNIRNLKAVAAGVHADYVVLGQLQRNDAGMRFVTHLIRLPEQTHLKANRLQFPATDLSNLEATVVAEFERAVKQHVLRVE